MVSSTPSKADSEPEDLESVFGSFVSNEQQNNNSEKLIPADEYDPFEVGSSAGSKKKIDSGSSVASKRNSALPPRIVVNFKVHEEVTSSAIFSSDSEGESEVFVLGTILAQVTSSDAMKNAPWVLVGSSPSNVNVMFTPNDSYAKTYLTNGETGKVNVIKVPKSTIGFVAVGKYQISERVDHMPLLLERNVVRVESKVQISIQVRSKLSNPSDLSEFSIALSISKHIIGESVEVVSGDGEYDRMNRSVIWNLALLPKGKSFLVSVRGLLEDNVEDLNKEFPVMLRCRSQDQISSAKFHAIEARDYPATVMSSTVGKSFRIIHRLH